MISILENNQIFEDGTIKVRIPKVLQPFMGISELKE
jgi:seryl-tRNA synthetase